MIDITKKYRCRNDKEFKFIRFLCDDLDCPEFKVVAVVEVNGLQRVYTYTKTGSYLGDHANEDGLDLIEVKEPAVYYVNEYESGQISIHLSKVSAEEAAAEETMYGHKVPRFAIKVVEVND